MTDNAAYPTYILRIDGFRSLGTIPARFVACAAPCDWLCTALSGTLVQPETRSPQKAPFLADWGRRSLLPKDPGPPGKAPAVQDHREHGWRFAGYPVLGRESPHPSRKSVRFAAIRLVIAQAFR